MIETIAKSGYRLKLDLVKVVDDSAAEKASMSATNVGRRRWLFPVVLLMVLAFFFALSNWRPFEQPVRTGVEQDVVASVAVMPFSDLGEGTSQSYFAEGITLDLITDLSRLPGLLVIAPGTVFGYREMAVDDRAIAAELGVRYLIRGGVQRVNDRLRINVRLLEAASGQTLWAERFVGETSSVFRIQDEVVEGITTALRLRLVPSVLARRRSGATESIAAYDEFLHGQERYGRRTPQDNRAAQIHFERAIALDPAFARAHAGLALSWSRLAIDGWTADAEGALSKAAGFAVKAASGHRCRTIVRVRSASCRNTQQIALPQNCFPAFFGVTTKR